MVRGDCWERLYIYIDPLSIYSTIFIIYNLVTYYTRGHVGIQVIQSSNLLHSGTCGYPSDTRPLNYILKFSLLNLLI